VSNTRKKKIKKNVDSVRQ